MPYPLRHPIGQCQLIFISGHLSSSNPCLIYHLTGSPPNFALDLWDGASGFVRWASQWIEWIGWFNMWTSIKPFWCQSRPKLIHSSKSLSVIHQIIGYLHGRASRSDTDTWYRQAWTWLTLITAIIDRKKNCIYVKKNILASTTIIFNANSLSIVEPWSQSIQRIPF